MQNNRKWPPPKQIKKPAVTAVCAQCSSSAFACPAGQSPMNAYVILLGIMIQQSPRSNPSKTITSECGDKETVAKNMCFDHFFRKTTPEFRGALQWGEVGPFEFRD